MYSFILILLLLSVSVFEVWLCYAFLYVTVFDKGLLNKENRITIAGSILLLGIILTWNRSMVFFSHYMLLCCVIVTSLCICLMMRHHILLFIEMITFYFLSLSLLDLLFAFFSIGFLGTRFDRVVFYHALSGWSIAIFCCSRFILFGCVMIIYRKRNFRIDMKAYSRMLLILDILLCFVMKAYQILLDCMALGDTEIRWWGVVLSLFVVWLVILLYFILKMKNIRIQKENEILLSQAELMREYYKKMDGVLEENRRLMHDVKNQFLILQGLETERNYEELRKYLQKLNAIYVGASEEKWSENQMLDLILKQKKSEAESRGIRFEIQEISFVYMPLLDEEVVSLFGNLLDNAIEACCKIEEGRFIKIEIEQRVHMLFIHIQNSIGYKPDIKNNKIRSTKTDKKIHGYGLKNVHRIVKKYDGQMSLAAEEGIFQVRISFFCLDIESAEEV